MDKNPKTKIEHLGRTASAPALLARNPTLSVHAKATWMVLSTWGTEVFPGATTLCRLIPCSRPRLFKSFKELESLGWLERRRVNRKQRETNLYILDYTVGMKRAK